MFRKDDLSQFFLGNSGPLKRQTEQRTQYFRDYEKSKRSKTIFKGMETKPSMVSRY